MKRAPYLHLLGNGGILSTTEDLFKWHKSLMTENILSKELKEKLPPNNQGKRGTTMLFMLMAGIFQDKNTFRVWHNGTNNIFMQTSCDLLREYNFVCNVKQNISSGTDQITFEIAKIILRKLQANYSSLTMETNQKFT
ncbi:MAG: hypothetical protein IPN15_22440 [Saprospiraceae bacterium]|nr:hypothetical protein [Candidatus Vicinibacter affinis]